MSPTSRVLAVLMLSVTIAASTAASAVVRAAVLSSLGVPDNARLLNIEPLRELPGRGAVVFNESYPNYLRLRDAHFDAFIDVTCALRTACCTSVRPPGGVTAAVMPATVRRTSSASGLSFHSSSNEGNGTGVMGSLMGAPNDVGSADIPDQYAAREATAPDVSARKSASL